MHRLLGMTFAPVWVRCTGEASRMEVSLQATGRKPIRA